MNNWENNLTNLTPYTAGEQMEGEEVIKLNANENPYPPSPAVKKVLKEFDSEQLKIYPKRGDNILDRAVSKYHNVGVENVFCGNSSDEVLAISYKAFFNSDKPILFPDITYSFYPVWCDFFGIEYKKIPLAEEFQINTKDYPEDNGGVIIPNPNAPTGIALSIDDIDNLLEKNQGSVVIIDEAYVDFGDDSAIGLINKYENLLVVRTTSKSRSLAGLRVGYAVGSSKLIQALNTAMNSFNAYPISTLSMEIAKASLEDEEYFVSTNEKIKATRSRTAKALRDMGFICTDSKTNFLFVTHKEIDAEELYRYLYDNKILVRFFGGDKLKDYLRISVGTNFEMDQFLDAVSKYKI